ncbi:MAG: GNAT family acetyltransferase [Myxococcota bacterium]|nr:GNAT family acetyltransferase [Myxococcota bacterium]
MDEKLQLRPYQDADEEAVVAIWNTVFSDPAPWNDPHLVITKKLATQRELFFVAVIDAAVVGTAMGGFDGHRGWLYAVAVRPDMQRSGIGSALVRRVEDALVARGCPKLNLQVRVPNRGVVAFYRRLGYLVEQRVSMGKRLVIS